MILEDYLGRNAGLYPGKTAVVINGCSYTYGQLKSLVDGRVRSIADSKHPRFVCLKAVPSIDFIVDYFAYHLKGIAVVPLAKDIPQALTDGISEELSRCEIPEGTADILYTTGTTGKSKGVMISHRTIMADAENLTQGQGFTRDTVFVINGPLNHIGSLSKVYPVILNGCTMIIVDGLKDLDAFFRCFEYPSDKMATFLVPASIRILIQFASDRIASLSSKMDFMETGAAAISKSDMEELCRLLPKTRLYNTYASTETGIITTYDFNCGKCIAGCLGRPMVNSGLFITEEGKIACTGDTLMTGYVGDPERTSAILRDGVIYTSDFGEIDSDGMLHLKGREDDVINVGGFKVAPLEVEDAAMGFPGISDCICIPVKHPLTGNALKLLAVMAPGAGLDKKALALFLGQRLEPHKVPMLYEQVESVRRTFNGKPDRKFYQKKV